MGTINFISEESNCTSMIKRVHVYLLFSLISLSVRSKLTQNQQETWGQARVTVHMVPQTGTNCLLSLGPFGHKATKPKAIRPSYSITQGEG